MAITERIPHRHRRSRWTRIRLRVSVSEQDRWAWITRWTCAGSVLVIALVALGTRGGLAMLLLLLACTVSFIGGSA